MKLMQYAKTTMVFLPLLCVAACAAKPAPANESAAVHVDRAKNRLTISSDNQIHWNGVHISEDRLADLLQHTTQLDPEPELEFRPAAASSYDVSAKVLGIMKASGARKFGFVGNEAYATPAKHAD